MPSIVEQGAWGALLEPILTSMAKPPNCDLRPPSPLLRDELQVKTDHKTSPNGPLQAPCSAMSSKF